MSTQDDALDFQNSAIAAAADSVDAPDEYLTEDPLGNNALGKQDPTARKVDRRERFTEAPRLSVPGVVYDDPDMMPQRINGRYITPATRERDRALLLEHPAGSKHKAAKPAAKRSQKK